MKTKRIYIFISIIGIILIAWAVTISIISNNDIYPLDENMNIADDYIKDELYIRAMPILEEINEYYNYGNLDILLKLLDAYSNLYMSSKYDECIKQIQKLDNLSEEQYIFIAQYYINNGEGTIGLEFLNQGIMKLNSETLIEMYDDYRYQIRESNTTFNYIKDSINGYYPAMIDGRWGIINTSNNVIIPIIYENISYYNGEKVMVSYEGECYILTSEKHKWSLSKIAVTDFIGGLEGYYSIKSENIWRICNSDYKIIGSEYDEITAVYKTTFAVKTNESWQILLGNLESITDYTFKDIITDVMDRCVSENLAFIQKEDNKYYMIDIEGRISSKSYDDAKLFYNATSKYTAVKKDGKWGFIDKECNEVLPFEWEEADSFSYGLAPVKNNEGKWGYINEYGKLVIECKYEEAYPFNSNSAIVKNNSQYYFIYLLY